MPRMTRPLTRMIRCIPMITLNQCLKAFLAKPSSEEVVEFELEVDIVNEVFSSDVSRMKVKSEIIIKMQNDVAKIFFHFIDNIMLL